MREWRCGVYGRLVICACVGVAVFLAALGYAGEAVGEKVRPTPYSMDFYGYIPGADVGDTIRIYDPDGVLCGEYAVGTRGQYGFVHVYGDDPVTAEDEGAEPGDVLTFTLNDGPLGGGDVVWEGDARRLKVDF